MTDRLVVETTPIAAELVCAVTDHDHATIDRILRSLDRHRLWALAVILAAHIHPDHPFVARPEVEPLTHVINDACAAMHITRLRLITTRDRECPASLDARAIVAYAAHLLDIPPTQVARALRRHHTTVQHARARAGDTPRLRRLAQRIATERGWDRDALDDPGGRPAVTDQRTELLESLIATGATRAEAAAQLGISAETLRKWCANRDRVDLWRRLAGKHLPRRGAA